MSRIVGILGGMGPLATADLYRKIILATPAARDQDHLHVVIDADPSVPDRTAALRGEAPDPTPWLLRGARRLEAAGVAFIVVPCNTAHAFLPAVRPHVAIPILDMIAETAARVHADFPAARRVGVLATRGTVESGLYHRALAAEGLEAITPDAAAQDRLVGAAIAAVKAGDTSAAVGMLVVEAGRGLVAAGAEVLLAACTELPLVLTAANSPAPLLDPTQALAEAAVREALAAPVAGAR
ncbi:MAG TPA: amino acid racemase [Thermomicrobiales bacterium]|nr:amino acid racemase [Thermomicrobiales bacterium]